MNIKKILESLYTSSKFGDRELYVFAADMLHPDAKEHIERNFSDNYLEGIGEVRGNKIIDRDRIRSLDDELMGFAYDTILEGKLDFLAKYRFDIEDLKRDIDRGDI